MKRVIGILLMSMTIMCCTKSDSSIPKKSDPIYGNYTDGYGNFVSIEKDKKKMKLSINSSTYNLIEDVYDMSYIVKWDSYNRQRIGVTKTQSIDTLNVIINYESMGEGETDSVILMPIGKIK